MDPASIVARLIMRESEEDSSVPPRVERNQNRQGRVVVHISSGPAMRRQLRDFFEAQALYAQIAILLENFSIQSNLDREELVSSHDAISLLYRRNVSTNCPSERRGNR